MLFMKVCKIHHFTSEVATSDISALVFRALVIFAEIFWKGWLTGNKVAVDIKNRDCYIEPITNCDESWYWCCVAGSRH